MPRPMPGDDEERLPWLEPYRDTPATTATAVPRASRRSGAAMLVGGAAALTAALSAGYFLGQRDSSPSSAPVEAATAPVSPPPALPAPPAAPQPVPIAPAPIAEVAPPVAAKSARVVKQVAKPTRKEAVRRVVPQRKIRNAGIDSSRLKSVRAAQERRPPTRPSAYRFWPKMPSPGPAGQVIQLGAFRHPDGAYRAYRSRLARYPALGRMPRVVVPVVTKPRGQILYVLRLGTTSRQHSRIVCRNLRASGDHCLVIG